MPSLLAEERGIYTIRPMFEKYIEISKALMSEGFETKTFHTTFIVRKKRLQKIGVNDNKTHPANLKYKYASKDGIDIRSFVGIHSELSAILKYGKEDCSDCTFINIRIDKKGNIAMAKPCRGCQDLLNQVGYHKLYYTNTEGEFEEWK
jgi:deoxycytidylate deaminase